MEAGEVRKIKEKGVGERKKTYNIINGQIFRNKDREGIGWL